MATGAGEAVLQQVLQKKERAMTDTHDAAELRKYLLDITGFNVETEDDEKVVYWWVKDIEAISGDMLEEAVLKASESTSDIDCEVERPTKLTIKRTYHAKLAKLSASHNRSMANMIEVLIDQALKEAV